MSFSLTADQILNRTKTVTRRLGWKNLQPGTLIRACRKCMGLKRGEKIEVLTVLKVKKVSEEYLPWIDQNDTDREGFPNLTPHQFVSMFCSHMGCTPMTKVTRIEFEYDDALRQKTVSA